MYFSKKKILHCLHQNENLNLFINLFDVLVKVMGKENARA
jgi:hypothetical protein